MKSILCRIIAVLMILVLIVNLSPIRVQASALPEVAGVVTRVIPFAKVVEPAALGLGGTIFCWVAAALGVGFTVYSAVEAYNNFQDYSGMLETSIYYYPDGTWSYGVDMTFVDKVRAFLFESGTISYTVSAAHTFTLGDYSYNITSSRPCDMVVFWRTGYPPYSGLSVTAYAPANGEPLYLYCNDKQYASKIFNGYAVTTFYNISGAMFEDECWYTTLRVIHDDSGCMSHEAVYEKYFGGQVAPSYSTTIDAQLGVVAPPDVDFSTGYSDWYGNARPATNPDTQEELTVLPIPLNPSADPETQIGTLTQPDIWQGTIADPMPDTDPDTGTDTDPDGSLSNTPWDAVKKWASDFFIPSGDITMYSLDLTELFPFCIPFDIFDLLSALRADPVAPVFELELDFGVTKAPITVDLSGWSDLASIIRILEVGLFCLGLALGTKELIGS